MGIQMQYDKAEDLPDIKVKELFTEKDGKMVFTGIEGIKTQSDIDALSESLRKERNDHAITKESSRKFENVDLSKVKDMENELITLRELKEKGGSEETISAIVEKRLAIELESIKSENEQFKTENSELKSFKYGQELSVIISESSKGKFGEDHLSTAEYILKSNLERQADGTYLTKQVSAFGIDAGMTIDQAVLRLTEKNPYMLPKNTAGNAIGNSDSSSQSASNPFAKSTFNRTEQHKLLSENPSLAASMQSQAQKE